MVVTDEQVRILWSWLAKGASLKLAAAKAGMDRKHRVSGRGITTYPHEYLHDELGLIRPGDLHPRPLWANV